MKKLTIISTVLALLTFGCDNQPDDPEPTEQPAQHEEADREDETIGEDDQKVNEQNNLEETENGCPEPRQTDKMCAQVVVWALSPDGECCQYPTPCHTPEGWETFQSAEDCEEAAE